MSCQNFNGLIISFIAEYEKAVDELLDVVPNKVLEVIIRRGKIATGELLESFSAKKYRRNGILRVGITSDANNLDQINYGIAGKGRDSGTEEMQGDFSVDDALRWLKAKRRLFRRGLSESNLKGINRKFFAAKTRRKYSLGIERALAGVRKSLEYMLWADLLCS